MWLGLNIILHYLLVKDDYMYDIIPTGGFRGNFKTKKRLRSGSARRWILYFERVSRRDDFSHDQAGCTSEGMV